MRKDPFQHRIRLFFILLGSGVQTLFMISAPAWATPSLLLELIPRHNLESREKSLKEGTYRGEEGILRIRPEAARSLGMKVHIDQDYLDAVDLFEEAERFLERAKDAMASRKRETLSGGHAQRIVDCFLAYRKALDSARKKLMAYRSRLDPGMDERLDKARSLPVMSALLRESLEMTDHRLRDALGRFYNVSQGLKGHRLFLTPQNVRFVNEIFGQFVRQAPKDALIPFDLDQAGGFNHEESPALWKKVMKREGFPHVSELEAAMKKLGDRLFKPDPLLFMALMKRESNFDSLAISSVGAAGLTQIMPQTALDLGMRKIYRPAYFLEGLSLVKQEREKSRQAERALHRIRPGDGLRHAEKARKLMQESLALGRKKERIFVRYRHELLKGKGDDRLNPALAIEFGLKYFAGLMEAHKGDASLALASYNAGPHRVSQFDGIPPFKETVRFRNIVLEYYRGYLKTARRGAVKETQFGRTFPAPPPAAVGSRGYRMCAWENQD